MLCPHHANNRNPVIIIIGIQPLGRFAQRPVLSQATGMTLVRCILGKFLGVVCHCFPVLEYNYGRQERLHTGFWYGDLGERDHLGGEMGG